MAERDDEFYTGYLPEAPPGIAAHVRRAILGLLVLTVAVALVLVFAQQGFSSAVYEFLVFRDFEGVVREQPYPILEVDPPHSVAGDRSAVYLVAPGKFGAGDEVAGMDGQRVRLQGSLIYRDDQTMIEVVPGSVVAAAGAAASPPEKVSLGTHTLRGRIVDSKCFLGIMKPGSTKPHRACATRCISGGIPPLLVVDDDSGPAAQLLLVGVDGRAVNAEVLDMVAEPVEITGEVVRRDDLLVLYADPATYRRWSS